MADGNLTEDLDRIQSRWIRLGVAARIAGVSTRTLRRRLRAISDDSGMAILRRWGRRGHWHVEVGAFATYMRHRGEVARAVEEIRSDVDDLESRLDSLRNSHNKLRAKVYRSASRQPDRTDHPAT